MSKTFNKLLNSDLVAELDASNTMFLETELERVETEIYDAQFAEMQYMDILPMDVSNDPGAESITYRTATKTGRAKLINSYSDDLPNVSKFLEKVTRPVYTVGDAYEYGWDDIDKAARNGWNLPSDMGITAREAVEREIDNVMLLGDSARGIEGFFNLSGVQSYTVPNDGTAASKLWSAKTVDQIIRDINMMIAQVPEQTGGVEMVTDICLPIEQYQYIASTPRASNSDTTILQFILGVHPGLTIRQAVKLGGILGSGNGERMIGYRRDRRKVKGDITYAFRQLPAQEVNLAFKVPCVSKIGGVVAQYPMSIIYADGI